MKVAETILALEWHQNVLNAALESKPLLEKLTKSDLDEIESLVKKALKSPEFNERVLTLSRNILGNLSKILYTRRAFWKDALDTVKESINENGPHEIYYKGQSVSYRSAGKAFPFTIWCGLKPEKVDDIWKSYALDNPGRKTPVGIAADDVTAEEIIMPNVTVTMFTSGGTHSDFRRVDDRWADANGIIRGRCNKKNQTYYDGRVFRIDSKTVAVTFWGTPPYINSALCTAFDAYVKKSFKVSTVVWAKWSRWVELPELLMLDKDEAANKAKDEEALKKDALAQQIHLNATAKAKVLPIQARGSFKRGEVAGKMSPAEVAAQAFTSEACRDDINKLPIPRSAKVYARSKGVKAISNGRNFRRWEKMTADLVNTPAAAPMSPSGGPGA